MREINRFVIRKTEEQDVLDYLRKQLKKAETAAIQVATVTMKNYKDAVAELDAIRAELAQVRAERDALKAELEKIDQMESVEDSGCNSVWDYLAEIKYIVHSALEAQKGGEK